MLITLLRPIGVALAAAVGLVVPIASVSADLPVAERGLLPGDLAVGPAVNEQGDLDIAFSGSTHLLVWRTNSLGNPNHYISGRLMNADGSFLGGEIVIAAAVGQQVRPTVTWDGSSLHRRVG